MPLTPTRTRAARRKTLSVLAFTIGASLLLAGCSGAASSAPTSGTPAGDVTYWWGPASNDASFKANWTKYNVTAFEKQNPTVKLQAIAKNVDKIDQTTQIALAAGQGPDLVQSPGTSNAIPYAAAGYLANLNSAYDKNGWGDKLLPWAAEGGRVDGKFVMIPTAYETLVLYYNKTLFQQNGWTPPTNQAELESLASKMQAKGVIPFAAGNADYQAATEWLVSAFMNEVAGPSKVYDGLTGKTPWTDPAFEKSIQLLKTYFDKGYFGGGTKQYFSTSDTQKYADFASGKAGMFISGTWEFQSLPTYFGANGNTDEFDWTTLPSLSANAPTGVYPLSIGGTLSVNAKSKNPYASTAYLNWLMSDTKNMWSYVAETGGEPLPVKFNDSDIPSSVDPRFARVYTSLQSATEKGQVGYTTWTSWGGSADTYITSNIDKVLNGSLSVSDFSKGLNTAFQKDKSRGLVPPTFKTGN